MKIKLYKLTVIVMLFLSVLSSCTKDFEQINTDPINTPNALPQQLLAPALVGVVSANMQRNRNFNNELMQVTISITDDEAAVFRYEYRNTYADYLWNAWYTQLTNFKDIYNIASQPVTLNTSYQGISLICQSWIYSMLTDTYGDVPYFKSNLAKDSSVYEPPFDQQKDIYLDIFKQLETANTLLAAGTAIKSSSDPVFNGNISKWRKFGNSLYLRLLLKLSGKAGVSADVIAKIKEMIDTRASTYPIMTGNDDSAVLRWTGGIYISPYQTIREQDWRAPAIGDFFISHLRDWADPRISSSTYGISGFNRWGIAQGPNGFAGVPSGYLAGTGAPKQSYFYSNTSAVTLQTDQSTGLIMNYAELQHILAEAAVKGFITTGTAQAYWETGVL
ncbi:MAG: SusD/RagB family nutrient-binding outer membrane lipoprotein, partial [Sphingobacteriaceae bacterium]